MPFSVQRIYAIWVTNVLPKIDAMKRKPKKDMKVRQLATLQEELAQFETELETLTRPEIFGSEDDFLEDADNHEHHPLRYQPPNVSIAQGHAEQAAVTLEHFFAGNNTSPPEPLPSYEFDYQHVDPDAYSVASSDGTEDEDKLDTTVGECHVDFDDCGSVSSCASTEGREDEIPIYMPLRAEDVEFEQHNLYKFFMMCGAAQAPVLGPATIRRLARDRVMSDDSSGIIGGANQNGFAEPSEKAFHQQTSATAITHEGQEEDMSNNRVDQEDEPKERISSDADKEVEAENKVEAVPLKKAAGEVPEQHGQPSKDVSSMEQDGVLQQNLADLPLPATPHKPRLLHEDSGLPASPGLASLSPHIDGRSAKAHDSQPNFIERPADLAALHKDIGLSAPPDVSPYVENTTTHACDFTAPAEKCRNNLAILQQNRCFPASSLTPPTFETRSLPKVSQPARVTIVKNAKLSRQAFQSQVEQVWMTDHGKQTRRNPFSKEATYDSEANATERPLGEKRDESELVGDAATPAARPNTARARTTTSMLVHSPSSPVGFQHAALPRYDGRGLLSPTMFGQLRHMHLGSPLGRQAPITDAHDHEIPASTVMPISRLQEKLVR